MGYSVKFFRDGLPEWKRKKDPFLSRIFYRPVSFFFSSFFCRIGWTANMVSAFSTIVALVACISFILVQPFIGALLINLWLVLDCADGNIARCVKKERYGDFIDSASSYVCVGLMFASMGYCAFHTGGFFFQVGNALIILLGAIAGSSDSLSRLLFQKYLNSSYLQGIGIERSEDPEKESGVNRVRMKVDAVMSLGGVLPLATLLGAILNGLDIVIVVWFAYYVLVFLASASYLIFQTFKANK